MGSTPRRRREASPTLLFDFRTVDDGVADRVGVLLPRRLDDELDLDLWGNQNLQLAFKMTSV